MVIAIDLDKTLCKGNSFSEEECLRAIPFSDRIDFINTQVRKRGVFIAIHTARNESLRAVTEYWLKKNEVIYDILVMGKFCADQYVDDKAINSKEFFKLCPKKKLPKR
jgi:hypothetical protein